MPGEARPVKPSPRLVQFVQAARQRGMNDAAIRASLIRGGWKPAMVQQALAAAGPAVAYSPPPLVPATPSKPARGGGMIALVAALVAAGAWYFHSAPAPVIVPVTTTSDAPQAAAPAAPGFSQPPLPGATDGDVPPPPPGMGGDDLPAAGAAPDMAGLPGGGDGAPPPASHDTSEEMRPAAKPECSHPKGVELHPGAPPGFPPALLVAGAEVIGHVKKGAGETVYTCVGAEQETVRAELTALLPDWEVSEAASGSVLPGFDGGQGPVHLIAKSADSTPIQITLSPVPNGTAMVLRRELPPKP